MCVCVDMHIRVCMYVYVCVEYVCVCVHRSDSNLVTSVVA